MNTIGIAGTGTMGRAAAEKLVEAGFRVVGFDVFPASAKRAEEVGVDIVGSLADLAARAKRVLLFLPGPEEIRRCVAGSNGLLGCMRPNSIIVDMCTSDPDATAEMVTLAGEKGVRYIDVPILGRPSSVGKWTLPAGGDAAAVEECKDVFEPIATRVVHIGPSGSGHKIKLLNQLMFGAINAMTAEMMALAEAVGVPPATLYETIAASQAGTVSNLFRELGARVGEGRHDDPVFTVRLLDKDVRLGVDMADKAGAPLIVARAVDHLNKASLAQGYGDCDTSVMWKCVQNFWKGSGG